MLHAVLRFVIVALSVYAWMVVARALLTWFPLRSGTIWYRVFGFLYDVTEPYLRLFRRFIPPLRAGNAAVDLSAFAGLVVLFIVIRVLSLI